MSGKICAEVFYEFWPWVSTIAVLSVDKFTGFFDWLFARAERLKVLDVRNYVMNSFLILYIILPALFVVYIYLSVIALHLYRWHRGQLLNVVRRDDTPLRKFVNVICYCWSVHARLWHSYEVIGFENVIKLQQQKKGLMIVYYHGALPLDVYYLNSWSHVNHSIPLRPVVDHFMFKVPGFRLLLDAFGALWGPRSRLEDVLREGEIVIVSPGGVREALHSKHYQQIWGKRDGFAKVAEAAQVPIVPMFTENVRQAFDFPNRFKGEIMRRLYEYTRLPLSLLFGGFPVKLKTYIGEPIDTIGKSVDEIRTEAQYAIEDLIKKHQHYRNDWWKGLLFSLKQRFVN